MKLRQQFGAREGDGLMPLEVSSLDPQATTGEEKISVSPDDFPKLTMLLDCSWKVTSLFGISGTRYEGQVPGLNYGNLILLFFVPDGDKPHAVGESWSSKIKLPGIPDEVSVKTTIKSTGTTDEAKSVSLHQDYAWNSKKIASGQSADSKAGVDSVFALDTGKLLKSHADCEITFHDPSKTKPEEQQYKATTKIDVLAGETGAVAPRARSGG